MDRKIKIRECTNAVESIRKYLVSNGMQKDEANKSTKHYYRTYKRGFERGAELQRKIDIDKACEWLDNELYQIKRDDFSHPEDIASSTYYEKTELLRAFRTAMEQ